MYVYMHVFIYKVYLYIVHILDRYNVLVFDTAMFLIYQYCVALSDFG